MSWTPPPPPNAQPNRPSANPGSLPSGTPLPEGAVPETKPAAGSGEIRPPSSEQRIPAPPPGEPPQSVKGPAQASSPVPDMVPPPPPAGAIPPPPPPVPGTMPSAPSQPGSPLKWILAGVAVVLLAGGYWVWNHFIDVPPPNKIQMVVTQQLGQPNLAVDKVSTKLLNKNGNTAEFECTAVAKIVQAQYQRVSLDKYLADHGADAGIFRQMQMMLSRANGKDILAEAKVDSLPAIGNDVTLVKKVAAAGQRITFTGHVEATHDRVGWEPRLTESLRPVEPLPGGYLLSAIGGQTMDIDDASNAATLDRLVKNINADTLAKLEGAASRLHSKEEAKYVARLMPGTLFKGTATKNNGEITLLYLEISKVNADRQELTATLRNDGGWDDYRRFQGSYSYVDTNGEFVLSLNSRSEQAVQSCGPFLDWQQDYQINFVFDGDLLTASPRNWGTHYELSFNRVREEEKTGVINTATEWQQDWLAATKVDAGYKVLVTAAGRNWSGTYDFKFTKQDRHGSSADVGAALYDRAHGWKKQFSGFLVLNKYRADKVPLRLTADSQDNRDAVQNDRSGPFAWQSFRVNPLLDDGRMVYEEGLGWGRDLPYWRWEFSPAAVDSVSGGGGVGGGVGAGVGGGDGGNQPPPPNQPAQPQSKYEDVLEMVRASVADAMIVQYIQNSGKIYKLSVNDIRELQAQKVSTQVIRAMLQTAAVRR